MTGFDTDTAKMAASIFCQLSEAEVREVGGGGEGGGERAQREETEEKENGKTICEQDVE